MYLCGHAHPIFLLPKEEQPMVRQIILMTAFLMSVLVIYVLTIFFLHSRHVLGCKKQHLPNQLRVRKVAYYPSFYNRAFS